MIIRKPFFVCILGLALSSALITDLVLGDTPFQIPISLSDDGSVFYISLEFGHPKKPFHFFIDTDTFATSRWIEKVNVHAPIQHLHVDIGSKTLKDVFFCNHEVSLQTKIKGFVRHVGILGMNPEAFIENAYRPLFFSQLRRQLGIPGIIGLDLESRPESDGQLFVGGYDKERIQKDTLVYTSVTSSDAWNIEFERISFGSQALKTEDVRVTTHTLGINFPKSSEAALQQIFPPVAATIYKPKTDGWYTPCANRSSLPEFSLQLTNGNFTLESKSFVDHRVSEGYCYVPFRFHEDERIDLGVVWMRRFYTVFDAENSQVGIAKLKPTIDRIETPFTVPLNFRETFQIGDNNQGNQDRFGLIPGQTLETRTISSVFRALNRQHEIPRIVGLSLLSSPQVFVGGIDSTQMEGKLTYTDAVFGNYFGFGCESFGFGEKDLGNSIEVRLNTVSPFIILPETTRSSVYRLFPRADESSVDEWWTPCASRSSLPSFGLTFAGKRWTLGSEHFTDRRSVKGNCRLLLNFQSTIWINLDLGLSWMRHFYIVLDEDAGRVGIANLAPYKHELHLKGNFSSPLKSFSRLLHYEFLQLRRHRPKPVVYLVFLRHEPTSGLSSGRVQPLTGHRFWVPPTESKEEILGHETMSLVRPETKIISLADVQV